MLDFILFAVIKIIIIHDHLIIITYYKLLLF
jgi:hypothetical protein